MPDALGRVSAITYNGKEIKWSDIGPIIDSINDTKASSDFKMGQTFQAIGLGFSIVAVILAAYGLKQTMDANSEETAAEKDEASKESTRTMIGATGVLVVGTVFSVVGAFKSKNAIERYNNFIQQEESLNTNSGLLDFQNRERYIELCFTQKF